MGILGLFAVAALCSARRGSSSGDNNGNNTRTANERKKNILIILCVLIVCGLLYSQREHLSILTDSEKLKDTTLSVLYSLRPEPGKDEFQALSVYMMGLCAWSFLGLMTIPIETAAGMVFGWSAFGYTWIGKVSGFLFAFWAGRSCLSGWANANLSKYTIFQILNSTALTASGGNASSSSGGRKSLSVIHDSSMLSTPQRSDEEMGGITPRRCPGLWRRGSSRYGPLPTSPEDNNSPQTSTPTTSFISDCIRRQWFAAYMTAFMVRFALMPETIKNFGSSVLPGIRWWHYLLACSIHGGYLTFLWTWLGVETAQALVKDKQKQMQHSEEVTADTEEEAVVRMQMNPSSSTATSTSTGLAIAFGVGGFVVFIVCPLCLAWWIRHLQRIEQQASKEEGDNDNIVMQMTGIHEGSDSVAFPDSSYTAVAVSGSTNDETMVAGGIYSIETCDGGDDDVPADPLSEHTSFRSSATEDEIGWPEDESIRSRSTRAKNRVTSSQNMSEQSMIMTQTADSFVVTAGNIINRSDSMEDAERSDSEFGGVDGDSERVELIHRCVRKFS